MFVLELLNEPSFIANIGDRKIRTLQDASNYLINGPLKSYETLGFSMWRVERREDGEVMGMSGLVKREGLSDIDIGFAFLPQFWAKGYARESASLVVDYARDVLRLKRLVGITVEENVPSIKLLEKLGMKFESLVTLPREGKPVKLFALPFEKNFT